MSPSLPPIGLGLMNLTWRPTQTPDAVSFATLRTALSLGATLWNTAEFYGPHPHPTLNLLLLSRYFALYPSDAPLITLTVKGGCDLESGHLHPCGDAASVRRSVEHVLSLLQGRKFVDIFQCARVDKSVSIEETVGVLAEFVRAGKIGGVGLSEAGAATIRRAHKIHPIAAVEVEVALWSREALEAGGVAETCAELGIPLIAYSPLGRGFLAGAVKTVEDIPDGDIRQMMDRFQPGNLEKNLEIVERVKRVAESKGCSLAQLCLAWVRAQERRFPGLKIIPIPGATTPEQVKENCKLVEMTEEEMRAIDEIVEETKVYGERFNERLKDGLMV